MIYVVKQEPDHTLVEMVENDGPISMDGTAYLKPSDKFFGRTADSLQEGFYDSTGNFVRSFADAASKLGSEAKQRQAIRVERGQRVKQRVFNLLRGYPEYDPSQPRDDEGQWTGGGGSSGSVSGTTSRRPVPAVIGKPAREQAEPFRRLEQGVKDSVGDIMPDVTETVAEEGAKAWMTPRGRVIDIGPEAHNDVAEYAGASDLTELLEAGGVRLYVERPISAGSTKYPGYIGIEAHVPLTREQVRTLESLTRTGDYEQILIDKGGRGLQAVDRKREGGLRPADIREALVEAWPEMAERRHSISVYRDDVTAANFIAARNKSKRAGYLSPLEPADLAEHRLFINDDRTVGFALDPKGDIQNVFNNGGPPHGGAEAMVTAISKGGSTLDCYDGYLNNYYRQFGFVETGRMKFNRALAPPSWDFAANDDPDVVFMAWKGYDKDADAALSRVRGPANQWLKNEITDVYFDDWDAAKDASRQAAKNRGRAKAAGLDGHGSWPGVRGSARRIDPGPGLSGWRIVGGSAGERTAEIGRGYPEYEPSQPRDEHGRWTSGGGSSGSSGKISGTTGTSGGKKKVKDEDFTKAKITLGSGDKERFKDVWDESVQEDPDKFKRHFTGGLTTSMTIDPGNGRNWAVYGDIYNQQETKIGEYQRYINLDNKTASSAYFRLRQEYKGKGIGKYLLAGNVEVYRQLGINRVNVSAALEDGGYAWAKFGYVPDQISWNYLSNVLQDRLSPPSGPRPGRRGTSTYTPDSWEEIGEQDQDRIEAQWMRSTFHEFLDHEVDSWRESGQALDGAKQELASDFPRERAEWAGDAIGEWLEERGDVPYTRAQIIAALTVDYNSRYGDGREDPDIDFDDRLLREPSDAPAKEQILLPGFEEVDLAEHLTESMRKELVKRLTKAFNNEAEDLAERAEPPDYLRESVEEFQAEYWSSLSERERYAQAERLGVLPEYDLEDDPEEEEQEELELEKDEDAQLRQLLRNRDPKTIWKVADHPKGKQLLRGTTWSGYLDLTDPETMARFNDYVGRRKKIPGVVE